LHEADKPFVSAVPRRYPYIILITPPLLSLITAVPPHPTESNLEVPVLLVAIFYYRTCDVRKYIVTGIKHFVSMLK
jgi:hypothetical protein